MSPLKPVAPVACSAPLIERRYATLHATGRGAVAGATGCYATCYTLRPKFLGPKLFFPSRTICPAWRASEMMSCGSSHGERPAVRFAEGFHALSDRLAPSPRNPDRFHEEKSP